MMELDIMAKGGKRMKAKRDYQGEVEAYLFEIGLWAEWGFCVLLWFAIWVGYIWGIATLFVRQIEGAWIPLIFIPFVIGIEYAFANGIRNYFRTITGK